MKLILIVEDEKQLLDALRDKLTREGFQIIETENGVDGLETALLKHPDLILLDIMMPKMDGMAVLKKLREDAWGKTAPVILLTNLSDIDHVSEALDDKVTDYLIKSDWDIDEVAKKIKEKLSKQFN
jgi:DNA-binding response OmpR family regulator